MRNQAEKLPTGIDMGSNYRLCSLDKAETLMGDTVQLVRLKDPMASPNSSFEETGGYNGDWSTHSKSWDRVSVNERDRLLGQLDIGEFWLSFVEFTQTFYHLECVHLDSDTARDEPSLSDKSRKWLMRMYQGFWRRGVSAGGCRNNSDSFHINPQLQLFLTEKEDVIISLNQHSVMEPKVIGFTLYNLNNVQSKITECLPKTFFKKHKSLLNSQYTNSRQISQRCELEPGRYLIMATTFEPTEGNYINISALNHRWFVEEYLTIFFLLESAFSIRLLGSSIRLALLETQTMLLLDPFPLFNASHKSQEISTPAGTAQYEPVFIQLADDHKTINCFDLQELLEACLPNDYIKSCANLQVCRQVVSLMDVSLNCNLKKWKIFIFFYFVF